MGVILVQGAESSEINYLESKLEIPERFEFGGFTFIKGRLKNIDVVISKIKVGEINSAIATTLGIMNFNPSLIINQGTSGAHGKDIHKGDIVIGNECLQINAFYSNYLEEGKGFSAENWILREYISDDDDPKLRNWKFVSEDLVNKVKNTLNKVTNKNIYSGVISSGDVWNREVDRLLYLNKEYNSLCEEMEMAGVYKTAFHFGVPAISIKIISNNEILKEEYDPKIAEELQEIVYKLILNMSE